MATKYESDFYIQRSSATRPKNTTFRFWPPYNFEEDPSETLSFQRDGYVVIENFLTDSQVEELKEAGKRLAESIPTDEENIVFNSELGSQGKHKYFLESGDKVRHFLEETYKEGDPISKSLNKIGHNLHWLVPEFKKVSFGPSVEQACRLLGLEAPVILQSMVIFKNPKIGSPVIPHQDSSYLFTEPDTLVGFWIALDDATTDNGCLWFIPGSHTAGVHRRWMRVKTEGQEMDRLEYDKPLPTYPQNSFTPCPVSKGSCVLIHGQVVHKSEHNKSEKSRHAYTFHVMDVSSKYSPDNWLQSAKGFPLIYS